MPSRPVRSTTPTSCNPLSGAHKTPRRLLQLLCQRVFFWPCPATVLHGKSLVTWASASLTTLSSSSARSGRWPDGRGTWCWHLCARTPTMPCALVSVLCVWARTSPTAVRSAARGGRAGFSTTTCATEVAQCSRWLFQLAWPPKCQPCPCFCGLWPRCPEALFRATQRKGWGTFSERRRRAERCSEWPSCPCSATRPRQTRK